MKIVQIFAQPCSYTQTPDGTHVDVQTQLLLLDDGGNVYELFESGVLNPLYTQTTWKEDMTRGATESDSGVDPEAQAGC